MMINRLEIRLRPSKILLLFFITLHFLAIAAVLSLSVSMSYKMVGVLFIFSSAYYCCWLNILQRSKKTIIQGHLSGNEWLLVDRQGHSYDVELLGKGFVSAFGVILHFKQSNRRFRYRSFIVARDAVPGNIFRLLKVHLSCV